MFCYRLQLQCYSLTSYFFYLFSLWCLGKDDSKEINITLKFNYLHELSFGLFLRKLCHIMAYAGQLKNNLTRTSCMSDSDFVLFYWLKFFFLNLENIYNIYKCFCFMTIPPT